MKSDAFVFGPLRLAVLSPTEATTWVVDRALAGTACVVVTPNVHHLRLALHDEAFLEIVDRAELCVADGWPLVLASRLTAGPRLPGRVAGVDLVDSVLERAPGLRVAILGGAPGAADAFARMIGSRHDVVLVDSLPPGHWESAEQMLELRERLRLARPNLVLTAIGAPRQELLADRLRDVVAGPILCCGAAVEMLAGIRPRAPLLFQRLGLEWAFRAALEPTRLVPRYARAGRTFLGVLVDELRRRPRGAS